MTEDRIRVGTFNVKRLSARERRRAGDIASVVRTCALDVLTLEEVELGAALEIARGAGFAHTSFVGHAHRAPRGVAVLHHAPALERGGARVPARWLDDKGFTRVLLGHARGAIELVGLHLDWLHRAARERQIREIATSLGPPRAPRVVLGDLNAMGPRALGRTHDDTVHALGRALEVSPHAPTVPTFPSARPRWALDWVLASEPLAIEAVEVLPTAHSDHALLVAELAWARAA
ncbi:MAG: endonuclease/exonuclease/phosphatase family protein [Sandaracinaceae bacterium]|jgi:endonuclease/exonuclease/phosphatase family metal-dependent hydrolase|nr:endonuclease/exonuclease/phosphatase family protein [Sandaracinaceae bacterium]